MLVCWISFFDGPLAKSRSTALCIHPIFCERSHHNFSKCPSLFWNKTFGLRKRPSGAGNPWSQPHWRPAFWLRWFMMGNSKSAQAAMTYPAKAKTEKNKDRPKTTWRNLRYLPFSGCLPPSYLLAFFLVSRATPPRSPLLLEGLLQGELSRSVGRDLRDVFPVLEDAVLL